jgi:hypothetical protein
MAKQRRATLSALATGVAAALLANGAMALDYNLTGFASLTAGKVLSGNGQNSNLGASYNCACFLANYEYAGVYQNHGWTGAPESVAGVQANVHINDQLNAVVQLDARDTRGVKASVDWAYLSYAINPDVTIQAGRKRIPMYYYADSNYVGYSYVWVRPPVDLYGWDVYDYDGANVMYKRSVGNDWTMLWNTWAGTRNTSDNIYWGKLYNGGVKTSSNWHNILGSYVDFSNETFGLRFIYMQNDISVAAFTAPGVPYADGEDGSTFKQKVYGAAFTADYENWLFRSEINTVKRTAPYASPNAPSMLVGLGYHEGNWTTMLSYSRYWEKATATYAPQRDDTRTLTVRWDFKPSMALKLQYDWIKDHSPTADGGVGAYFGDAKLATVSLVTTF